MIIVFKFVLPLLSSAALLAFQPVVAKDLDIITSGKDYDHDCKGGEMRIRGSSNNVKLANCSAVYIVGSSNNVWVKTSNPVKVMGSSNDVWIDYEADGSLEVTGSSNDVEILSSADQKIEVWDRGSENRISRKTR